MFSSEVSVDAAEQVMTKTGKQIEMAELIIQLKGNPQSLTNDNMKRASESFLSALISGIPMQWKQVPCGF